MEEIQIRKVSENEIGIIEPVEVIEKPEVVYTLDFLKQEEQRIIDDMEMFRKARQIDLDRIQGLISKAEGMGIKLQGEIIK